MIVEYGMEVNKDSENEGVKEREPILIVLGWMLKLRSLGKT